MFGKDLARRSWARVQFALRFYSISVSSSMSVDVNFFRFGIRGFGVAEEKYL